MKYKILFFAVFASFIFIPSNFSLAYEPIPTHRDLTAKIIEVYNKYYEPKITKEEADWMINGAIKEDTAPRWVNHFYDPVYKVGWNGENQSDIPQETVKRLSKILLSTSDAVSSVDWLRNQNLQEKYGRYEGNQTYSRALESYAWAMNLKNKGIDNAPGYASFETAFKALGHSLHLLEDLGVPAHTRNDSHGDGDPYELWAAMPGNDDLTAIDNLKIGDLNFECQKIYDCFVNLATYTNGNFYSKDTIEDAKYKLPTIVKKIKNDNKNIYFDSNNNLLAIKEYDNGEYTIEDNQIHQAYWNLLSKQIVLAGVQTLKVFYQNDSPKEIENTQYKISYAECNIPIFCAKEKIISPLGEFSKLADAANSFIGNVATAAKNTLASAGSFIKNIFGTDGGFRQVDQVVLNDQAGSNNTDANAKQILDSVNTNKPSGTKNKGKTLAADNGINGAEVDSQNQISAPETTDDSADANEADVVDEQITNDVAVDMTERATAKSTASETSSKLCSFNSSQTPSHNGVIINEIAWMGTANSANDEWIELKNISNTTVNLSGWQILSKDGGIKINLSGIKNVSTQAGKLVLLERTDDSSAPNVSADLIYTGALSNSNEELKLFDSKCNLIDSVAANSNWPAGDNAAKKTMERNTDGSSASLSNPFGWHTSANSGGTPKVANSQPTTYNFSGGGGVSINNPSTNSGNNNTNAANNNQLTNSQQLPKILISEIQISPVAERFIELYNPNDVEVSLTDWYIQRKTESGEFETFVSKTKFEGKKIPANGYFLISRSALSGSDIVINDLVLSESNAVQLKNSNKEVSDKIGWGNSSDFEGFGAVGNPAEGQSIRRKFEDGNFVDTDNNANDFEIQNCSSPKAPLANCPISENSDNTTAAVALTARFSFSPGELAENEPITFSAASSTAGDGGISLYEWRFGDNAIATSTVSVITHSFASSGIYTIQLSVYGDNNSSSTASLDVNVNFKEPGKAGVSHIVISEIMAGAGDGKSNEEFIELYNPTGSPIDLSGYSLKRKSSAAATSAQTLANTDAFSGKTISSKSFFLIASNEYQGAKIPDIKYSSASYHLAYDDDAVILYDGDLNAIDEVVYERISEGQSLERKAFSKNSCLSSYENGEFSGNGCDTDNDANDFEIRAISNPQNSASLPEPRNAPATVQNFNIDYASGSAYLSFDWQASVDYSGATSTLIYKIVDMSYSADSEQASSLLSDINIASTATVVGINEVGRVGENNYKFSIQAVDSDGLASEALTASIDVLSFIKNLSVYRKPDGFGLDKDIFGGNDENLRKYLLEFGFDQYPFISGDSYKVLIFYLNSEPASDAIILEGRDLHFVEENNDKILKIGYRDCSIYPGFYNSLILAETPDKCHSGDLAGASLIYKPGSEFNLLEDENILLPAFNSKELDSSDYFTVAFYEAQTFNSANLIAVDKTKYYFQNEIPGHQAPSIPGDLNVEYYSARSTESTAYDVEISWIAPTDVDTIDRLIKYEWSLNGIDWQELVVAKKDNDPNFYAQLSLESGRTHNILVRAVDDFGGISGIAATTVVLPQSEAGINLTPDSSNPFFAVDEAKLIGGALQIKWRLIESPAQSAVFGIIPFNSSIGDSININTDKALHKDYAGNGSYPNTTASAAPNCNATITPIDDYTFGRQYQTNFSSLNNIPISDDLEGDELQFYIYSGRHCNIYDSYIAGEHIFKGYSVTVTR